MVIEELLKVGIENLKVANIESPISNARILLAHTLNTTKEYIVIHNKEEVSVIKKEEYIQNIEKLINGIPIQYITNCQEFMKLELYVDENVLIPRADTEVLVEEVIQLSKERDSINILDLCTGSGAIAISCAKYIQKANVFASDYSIKALEVAKRNCEKHNVNINFIHSNMFEKIGNLDLDIIISNPPYIRTKIIDTLQEQVKHEPKMALDGGEDGLRFYKIIIDRAFKYLKKDGYLCMEIGYDQKDDVIGLLKQSKKYKDIYSKKDLCGNDRIVVAKKVGEV